jgi:S1-C subfamily serine protease
MMASVQADSLVVTAKAARGKIVQIVVSTSKGKSLGSGFWINDQGYVATCLHVVSGEPTDITVQSSIDPQFDLQYGNIINANWAKFGAKVVGSDPVNDVAILRVEPNPFGLRRAAAVSVMGTELTAHYEASQLDDELPQPGEVVLIAGFPLGQAYSVLQTGTIASIAYDLPGWGPTVKILISSITNHGNSGGPVMNSEGKVVGLLEGELRVGDNERTGLEVAVPVIYARRLLQGMAK